MGQPSTNTETLNTGDIVLYVGDRYPRRRAAQKEYCVVGVNHAALRLLVSVDAEGNADWFAAAAGALRVVRRATYLTDEHVQLLSDALTLFWHRAPVRRDEVKALLTAVPTLGLDGGDYDPSEES
jgi:hypothetical protein